MRDDELVGQILGGDTAQFEALVDRYLPMVRGLCRSRVANASSHDDLVQEVFLQGYMQLDRLRDRARFGPWLARIASNQCYTWLRSQGRRMQLDTHLASEAPRVAPPPDVEAMQRETVDWVRQAIARLPEKIRDAMTLFYVEGLTVSEAARCLEIRESALRKRLQYGRQAVGQELFAKLEPQTLPESEKREQKARVLAALPLATAPWKAGVVAGNATIGLAVLTKLALVTLPVAVVAVAAVAAGTGWRPSWPDSTAPANVAVRTSSSGGELSQAVPDASQADSALSGKPGSTGDVALTVTYIGIGSPGLKVEEPPAANVSLWLVPVHIDRVRLSPLLREAGIGEKATGAVLAALDKPRPEVSTWAELLAGTGVTEEECATLSDKITAALKKEGGILNSFFAPAYSEAREVVTDAQGRVEATGLPTGRYQVCASKPTAATAPNIAYRDGLLVQAGKRTEFRMSISDPFNLIQGTVTDAKTGKPVKGVTVAFNDVATASSNPTSNSDADGRFSFNLATTGCGPFTLLATSDIYAPVTVHGERRPGTPTFVEIRLDTQRAVVTGRVTNADGTPAPGVGIMREKVAGDGGAQGGAMTDAEGRYTLPHDGGRLTLYAAGTQVKSESVTLELQMDEVATQDFVLPPWGSLALDLRAPLGRSEPDEVGGMVLYSDKGCRVGIGLEKREGLFRLDYLEPGDYTLLFALEDYEGVRLDFQIPAPPNEQRSTVALKMPEGGVRVRALDAKGRPKPDVGLNVHVMLFRYDDNGRKKGSATSTFNCNKPEGGRTDANGECLLQGLPPGEYKVMSGDAEAEFVVPTNETVIVRMKPVATEPGPAYAYLRAEDLRPVDEKGAELSFRSNAMELFIVAASGTVSPSQLEVGHNTVYAILGGHTAGVANVDLSAQTLEERRQEGFSADPVKPVFGASGAITGVLTNEAGEPRANRALEVLPAECFDAAAANWATEHGRWEELMQSLAQGAKTQADGSFRIDFLPEGSYYVGIETNNSIFSIEGNPVEVRKGADTGLVTLIETADDKIRCP